MSRKFACPICGGRLVETITHEVYTITEYSDDGIAVERYIDVSGDADGTTWSCYNNPDHEDLIEEQYKISGGYGKPFTIDPRNIE
jgi:hypothetical protein